MEMDEDSWRKELGQTLRELHARSSVADALLLTLIEANGVSESLIASFESRAIRHVQALDQTTPFRFAYEVETENWLRMLRAVQADQSS